MSYCNKLAPAVQSSIFLWSFFSERGRVSVYALPYSFRWSFCPSYMVYMCAPFKESRDVVSLLCILFVLNVMRMAGSNRLKTLMAPTQNKRGFHAFVLLFGSQLFICVYTLYSPRLLFLLFFQHPNLKRFGDLLGRLISTIIRKHRCLYRCRAWKGLGGALKSEHTYSWQTKPLWWTAGAL